MPSHDPIDLIIEIHTFIRVCVRSFHHGHALRGGVHEHGRDDDHERGHEHDHGRDRDGDVHDHGGDDRDHGCDHDHDDHEHARDRDGGDDDCGLIHFCAPLCIDPSCVNQ